LIDINGTWSFDFGWLMGPLCGCPLVLLVGFAFFLMRRHSRNREVTAARSGSLLESDLQPVIARMKSGESTPGWTPPKLPYSVMACIWTHRLIDSSSESVYGSGRNYVSTLRVTNWQYRDDSVYIIVAALLSLRDAGLITIQAKETNRFMALSAIRIARTDAAVNFPELPLVEGGLLMACEDLATRRFFKTTAPSTQRVLRHFVRDGSSNHYQWVAELAAQQACQLDLCEPAPGGRRAKRVYSLEHLAACDEQVVAFVARWREFATNEPDIQQRLFTETAFSLRSPSG
jgi:hypothetical protein